MRFTDIFIRRPVLASVVSLIILLLGLNAIRSLQVRQFPELESAVITITTSYAGASSELIAGFITSPIQQAVASAEGIDYMTSSSAQGLSTVTLTLKLGYDSSKAMTEVLSKVAEARKELPANAEDPIITKSTGDTTALLYLSFYSEQMREPQITDYLKRVVRPQLETQDGVAKAQILGEKAFALRVWLNPGKLAAFDLTPQDIARALNANSFLAAAGTTESKYLNINISTNTDLRDLNEFQYLVVKREPGSVVRLRDIATVELGAENDDSSVYFNGKRAVFIAITAQPSANPLEVIDRIYAKMPDVQRQLPSALEAKVAYDATRFIRSSIDEVVKTVGEATVIVIFVIFLFLGSLRSVLIPVVTIPLSLVGVCFMMLVLGYSLNLLTLLAMVLAIGLVVDDAIVVVENIHRHIEDGMTPTDAAIRGAREIASPVISMTLTLATVYAPIGFMGGLTGGLFREFAFTLAGAVVISGIIALTLSPMMCSKLLKPAHGGLAHRLDAVFEKLRIRYERKLHGTLDTPPVMVVMVIALLIFSGFLYSVANKELARVEDQGIVFSISNAPKTATGTYVAAYTPKLIETVDSFPEKSDSFIVEGANGDRSSVMSGMLLVPWNERSKKQSALVQEMQGKLGAVAGVKSVSFDLPSLPGSSGLPVQFVLTSAQDYRVLFELGQELIDKARASGMFIYMDSSLKFDTPQSELVIDRNKAAELGINMEEIGAALSTSLGGGYVNRFNVDGRSYKIIPQVEDAFRGDPSQLAEYYVRTASGQLVSLATLTHVEKSVIPNSRPQFQQLNSMTIDAVPMPGVSLGDALAYLQKTANETLPLGIGLESAGQSRQFLKEGNALLLTFVFALILIYLVLAAQFESWRDPFIILISVPLSLVGALLPIALGATSINIYTQIGLVTLIGLISKHGILIVEFANQLQRERGMAKREAVEHAAGMRLRAILMTTASMVVGVVPLIIATGAGAASRFDIGLVVASGLAIGTMFTLFVVPSMYLLLARDHRTEAEAQVPTVEPITSTH